MSSGRRKFIAKESLKQLCQNPYSALNRLLALHRQTLRHQQSQQWPNLYSVHAQYRHFVMYCYQSIAQLSVHWSACSRNSTAICLILIHWRIALMVSSSSTYRTMSDYSDNFNGGFAALNHTYVHHISMETGVVESGDGRYLYMWLEIYEYGGVP